MGAYIHLIFLNNLEHCKESLMICQQLCVLPHCDVLPGNVGMWCSGCFQVKATSAEVCSSVQAATTVVRLCLFMPFSYNGAHCIRKVAKTTENLPSVMTGAELDREQLNADLSTSTGQTRESNRKAVMVLTLDKKGICSRSRKADAST